MALPKTINILGKSWQIKPEKKRFNVDGQDAWGSCDIEKCLIRYCSHINKQQQKDTVLHEVTHAISDTLALDLTEEQVHSLGAAFYQLLSDNPKLTRWVSE